MPKPVKDLILDCRSLQQYQQGHFFQAANIPLALLPQRLFQLPATTESLVLHACSESAEKAQAFLNEKGYQVKQVVICDSALQAQWQRQGVLEVGDVRKRLWQPSNIVKHWSSLGLLAKNGLDVGCGAGRDSVYLAQQGISMTAIDSLPRNVVKARQLAAYYQCDIEFALSDIHQWQPQETFDLIVVVRFLSRALFEKLKLWLNPGGFLLYQTFMQGAEQFGGPKNPNYLLQENELAEFFSDFAVLENTVETLADGRPLSWFIAQKRG